MNCYDVVGYADTENGYCVCLNCVTEEEKAKFHPIFADSEWDAYPSCDRCLEAITDVRLTEEGRKYHEEMEGNDV